MKNNLYLKFCILLLLSVPTLVYSQKNSVNKTLVKGILLDFSTSETIPYGTIRVYDDQNPDVIYKIVAADENGKFRFDIDKKGDYTMSAESVGKVKTNKEFSVGDSKVLDLGNILMLDDSKLLGEIVVTAQKPLVKVDLDKITYSIEDDPESKTNTAFDMLKKVPMVTVDGEDNIQLKGSSGYKIYMDGKPSTMIASNPKDVLKSMPASSIKNIEVITDPGSKYDAEGLAGIINIITNKQSAMGGYNARINTRVDMYGGYGLGGFLTMKKGKFGFTGNYNYYSFENPRIDTRSYTENRTNSDDKYLLQNGTQKYNGNGQYGSGEVSYEIDTLNLINVGFNRYHGSYKNKQYNKTTYENTFYDTTREYEQWTKGTGTYGATSVNVDYQRSSGRVKDRLFTASYRFNTSPNDWSSNNVINAIINSQDQLNDQYSDGQQKEHTFQIDYTTPFAKIHTFEAGVKYIIRLNESNSGYKFRANELEDWTVKESILDKFKHEQDIASAYLGYNVKLNKFGFKTGARYEYTDVKGKYPLDSKNDFGTDYSNLVPSATITYQLKPMQSFRLGYNIRILRPSIRQLNPFSNTTDSTDITTGNPKLDAVKSHTISLNYSYFNPKLNINSNLSYDFSDNNIEQITTFDNGIRTTTYENIGNNKRLGLYTYINWTPTTKIRITANLSGSYVDIKSNNEDGLSNNGFSANIYTNVAYTLPAKFRVNVYGGGRSKSISLQGEGGAYSFYGMSVSKDLMNDKLNLNLSASNFFQKAAKFKDKTVTPTMYMRTEADVKRTWINFSVAFKFGEMKEQIKKAKRTISNDDSISNSSGSTQSGQQGAS